MSYHLIIGDKLYSSWSLRGALALELAGVPYDETLIKLNQPDTRQRILAFSSTGKVPLLKSEHGVIADSLAIAEYLNEQHPDAQLWPADAAARAQARSACAQMHSGFLALRGAMPFDLSRDQALDNVPLEVQVDIDLLSRCGPNAAWWPRTAARSCSASRPWPTPSSPRWPCACAPTAWKCRQRRQPTSKPFISGQPSRRGSRPAWRSVKVETDTCCSGGHSWY